MQFVYILNVFFESQSLSFINTVQSVQIGTGNIDAKDAKNILNVWTDRLDFLYQKQNSKNKVTNTDKTTKTGQISQNKFDLTSLGLYSF